MRAEAKPATWLGALVLAVAAAGCFRIQPPEGSYRCAPGPCPRGYVCASDHTCRLHDLPDLGAPAPDLAMTTPDLAMAAPDLAMAPPDIASNCPIVYVSRSTGDDGASGCSSDAPKKTIGAALVAGDVNSHEIHVCAGTYSEDGLELTRSLLGSYDCKTWQRTATYGDPTFDSVNQTYIDGGPTPTLTVSAGSNVTIDGLYVEQTRATNTVFVPVLLLRGGDSHLSNLQVMASSANTLPAVASIAIDIAGAANVDLAHSHANGGGGAPSSAVVVEANSTGKVHIHDNSMFNGGFGNPDHYLGSNALLLQGNTFTVANGTAIENNTFKGGSGSPSEDPGFNRPVGIYVATTGAVELLFNRIDGGFGYGVAPAGIVRQSTGTATLRMNGNRVFGGHGANLPAPLLGMAIDGVGGLVMTNNWIDGGDDTDAPDDIGTAGISISESAAGVVLQHNTIFASNGPGLDIGYYARAATVENNIFFGRGGPRDVALATDDCLSDGLLASERNNLIFGTAPLAYACDSNALFTTMSAAAAQLTSLCTASTPGACSGFGGARASGNVRIAADCSGDSACIVRSACITADGCAAGMFADFDASQNGSKSDLGDGWKLVSSDPCAVVRSSLDLSHQVPADLYGTTRPATPSMGAHQFGDCTP